MGIYIPNMEMPTRCGRCDMCVPEADGDIDWHNVCCITGADIVDVGEKMVDCPLVPVPPHGRLIDGDAFLALINASTILSDFLKCIINPLIRGEPTVIEAEEGE